MKRIDLLKKQRVRLREDISAMLDSYLIGTVAKSLPCPGTT